MHTIYTVAIGARFTKTRWARDCLKAWEKYCDRHNLNLHVQTTPTHPFKEHSTDPKFEKFNFIHQTFDDGILVVDLDTVPRPDMPNVFDLYSDRNITCRVNPEWGPGHHFFLWSQAERFDALFNDLSWPRFGDIITERERERETTAVAEARCVVLCQRRLGVVAAACASHVRGKRTPHQNRDAAVERVLR